MIYSLRVFRALQAVFKKFLSATKNKVKGNLKVQGPCASNSNGQDEEFEARKHEWQVQEHTGHLYELALVKHCFAHVYIFLFLFFFT
jgi:hypothetical protein